MFRKKSLMLAVVALAAATLFAPKIFGAPKLSQLGPNQMIKPEQLVKILSTKSSKKPLVLQVGFQFLYEGGHIDGAKWAGPASRPDGIQRLKDAVKNVPKDRYIVIYCGCCPWAECPNIRPAFEILKQMGFKDVKALYIPINFARNWIEKGYPITKGSKPGPR